MRSRVVQTVLHHAPYDCLITIHTVTYGTVENNVRDGWRAHMHPRGRAELSITEAAQSQVTGTAGVLSRNRNCVRTRLLPWPGTVP
jgi:hypothetical protein